MIWIFQKNRWFDPLYLKLDQEGHLTLSAASWFGEWMSWGDSTHELISVRKPSKLVPAAGSTTAHWDCSWDGLIPGVENCRVTQVWEESERRGADWLTGAANIGAVDRDIHQLLHDLVRLSGGDGGKPPVTCVLHGAIECLVLEGILEII